MLNALLWNLLLTTGLAIVLAALCRLPSMHRRPALRYWLWLLLVAKLVTPPLVAVPLLPAMTGNSNTAAIATTPSQPTMHHELALDQRIQANPAVDGTTFAAVAEGAEGGAIVVASPQLHGGTWAAYLGVLGAVSLMGTCVLLIVHGFRAAKLYRWLKRAGVENSLLGECCADVASSLKIRGVVRSCVVDTRTTPLLWAWCRPLVVVPRQLIDDLNPQQLRGIVAHELAHLLRRDHWANLFVFIVKLLLWWNPVIWWAERELRVSQELCCDAIAIDHSGANRHGYATTLLKALDFIQEEPLVPHALALRMGSRVSILRRFKMIGETQLSYQLSRWTLLILLAMAIPMVCIPVRAQEEKPAVVETSSTSDASGAKTAADAGNKMAGATARFTAKLPDGVTVELLGVSTHPSNQKSWWRPDGSPLAEPPCDTLKGSVDGGADHVAREFAVQLSGLSAEAVGTVVKFVPTYNAYAGATPTRSGKAVPGLEAMTVSLPDKPKVTVRVGVAAGPWQTVYENNKGSWAVGTRKGGFVFSPILEKDGGVSLTVAYNIIGPQMRLVAVGLDGQEHSASSTSGGGAANFRQITATFSGLSPRNIKTFRLQTRPYKWVDFHNVSLRSGQETAVRILQNWDLANGTRLWSSHTSTRMGAPISDEELDEAIKEKKYKFLKTFDSKNGVKQYVYSLTFSDGRSVGMNFSMRLEDSTSLDDYAQKQAQKQAEQQKQRRDRINQAVAAGRIRLLNVNVMESHICRDVNSGIKFKVQRIRHPDGKEIAFPRHDFSKIPTSVKKTSWQDHLQAIRDGKRRLLGVESVNSYTYEMTADDGAKEIFHYGGSKPLLQKIKGFGTEDKLITKDGITVEQDAWRIDAAGTRIVRLFEIPNPTLEDCRVIYRAKLKSENLEGRAYMEMWCRMPGGGEFFSKGLSSIVHGTTDWTTCETPFSLKKGERPDLIKLNLVVEGKAGMVVEKKGTVWIKDVELLKGSLLEK